jgi:hypothetical protein
MGRPSILHQVVQPTRINLLHAGLARCGHDVTRPPNPWILSRLIAALDRVLTETEAEDWVGQLRWLSQWRRCLAAQTQPERQCPVSNIRREMAAKLDRHLDV